MIAAIAASFVAYGCGNDDGGSDGAGGTGGTIGSGGTGGADGGTGGTGGSEGGTGGEDGGEGGSGGTFGWTCEGGTPSCTDQATLALSLQPTVAPGLIVTTEEDGAFVSRIDATAGGAFPSTPHAYVYGRFTSTGLEKVEISDEEALESSEWDIAFRRFFIRINSGNSGPSCVAAALTEEGTDFDDATAVEDLEAYVFDDFYTASCELIPDASGLETSPDFALSDYYVYGGCLAMSHNVYSIRLASGDLVKLEVLSYYGEQQSVCDVDGTMPSGVSGNVIVRWAFFE